MYIGFVHIKMLRMSSFVINPSIIMSTSGDECVSIGLSKGRLCIRIHIVDIVWSVLVYLYIYNFYCYEEYLEQSFYGQVTVMASTTCVE